MIGVITLSLMNFKPATDSKGLVFAILTGLTYGIGCLFYFIAASKGKIMTVVTLTSLYPVSHDSIGLFIAERSGVLGNKWLEF